MQAREPDRNHTDCDTGGPSFRTAKSACHRVRFYRRRKNDIDVGDGATCLNRNNRSRINACCAWVKVRLIDKWGNAAGGRITNFARRAEPVKHLALNRHARGRWYGGSRLRQLLDGGPKFGLIGILNRSNQVGRP